MCLSKIARVLLALLALLPGAGGASPLLINAQQATFRTSPEYIRDHFAHIDALPFDGMVISTATSRRVMSDQVRTYAQMSADFAPLDGLPFTRMKHNLALVNVDRPADFFGDWSVAIENFRTLARVVKERGFAGICFDNEEYSGAQYNYPDDCAYPEKSLVEYSAQARLRGRHVMQAVVGEFPDIVFLTLIGPYNSHSGTPAVVLGGGNWDGNELRGAFTAGLIEGADSRTRFVDGGEVYTYRSAADFQTSYDFRKFTIASAAEHCLFIPAPLRSVWAQRVSIGFGIYNLPYNGAPMDPGILRTTLERALNQADDYVWLYFENENWNAPGEIAPGWIDAVVGARAAVATPAVSPAPSVSIVSPAVASTFQMPATLTLAANASDADGSITKVEFFDGAAKLGETTTAPYQYAWSNPAAGTHSLTAKATDDSSAQTISSAVPITISTSFSAQINFQIAGVTPPVGYFADHGDAYGSRGNGLEYGWNVSHVENARLPGGSADLRLATLCQMRSGGVWEIAVPNGDYAVTVGIGDGGSPSTHTINVEGVNYWSAQALAAGEFVSRTHTITVTDGRLTIDQGAAGYEDTRIDYVLIAATTAPPAAPRGLSAVTVSADAVDLRWTDESSNESGFMLQRSTSADFSTDLESFTLAADATGYLDMGVSAATTYHYRLRAFNTPGPSVFSDSAAPATPILDIDGDGIHDPLETAPLLAGADDRSLDSDSDGFANAVEWAAGTDPASGQSRPQLHLISAPGSTPGETALTLMFSTLGGHNYLIDYTDSPPDGLWTMLPGSLLPGDGEPQVIEDLTASPARFYRLRTWR